MDVARARTLACTLLAEALPRRWAHTQGVARKAESVAHIVVGDADLLVSAAWLHDIGYAPALARTGLHALDGARYLRDVEHADERLCGLVAYHSCAIVEAHNRGLAEHTASEFEMVPGVVADALTYCDMTTSPDGVPTDVEARLEEILVRYGDDVVARSIRESAPEIVRSARAVESMVNVAGDREFRPE